jgi:hypothetical protein
MTQPRNVPFDYDRMPTYDGPGSPITLNPDCCANEECVERDYNRAVILTLMRLSQAYAAIHLLHWSTVQVWSCDDAGHTTDCPNPGCTFGRDMASNLVRVRENLATVVKDLFTVLTVPAANLEGEWQAFLDTDMARLGIDGLAKRMHDHPSSDPFWASAALKMHLDLWRMEVVDSNDLEYARWFKPPAFPDGPPS